MVEQIPKQVGIRALKAHLSTYVKWAEAGHDITITDHGRPAARLVAPDPSSADVMPASLGRHLNCRGLDLSGAQPTALTHDRSRRVTDDHRTVDRRRPWRRVTAYVDSSAPNP
jgi:prevent-host-death family protein